MFRSLFYRTYSDESNFSRMSLNSIPDSSSSIDVFCIPPTELTKNYKFGRYTKLDKDGLISPGHHVSGGNCSDILMGKVSFYTSNFN